MDKRLSDFIDSMETLCGLRNIDANNPVVLEIEQPLTANLFTTVGSVNEPSYMGIPVHTTWVVLNPASAYNKKALKLASTDAPVTNTVPNAIKNAGFTQSWVEITNYDEIFADAQFYNVAGGTVGPQGIQGPQGLTGPQGFQGPAGVSPVVDYNFIISEVAKAIPKALMSIDIIGPASVNEQSTATYTVTAVFSDGSTQALATPITWSSDVSIGTIDVNGVLTPATTLVDVSGNVHASFTYSGVTKSASKVVSIVSRALSSIAILGSTSVNESTTSQYSVTATFNDGTTLTNALVDSWSSDAAIGTISVGGLLSAPAVAANTIGGISSAYTYRGLTKTATLAITVVNVPVIVYPYYGVADVSSVKNEALILGLTGRGTVGDLVGTFTLNSGVAGSTTTMFYAYPVSYGFARFEDAASPGFFGGWDAATGDPTLGATGPATINVMVDGVSTPFYLYQTDFTGLGSVTWNVSHKP